MGKIKKLTLSSETRRKDQSLTHQIIQEDVVAKAPRTKERTRREEKHEKFVSGKLSENILRSAREQQDELEESVGPSDLTDISPKKIEQKKTVISIAPKDTSDDDSEPDEPDNQEFYEPINVTEEEEKALEMFMKKDGPAQQTLAEVLRGKLSLKKDELNSAVSEPAALVIQNVDPRIVELYRGVRDVLKKYRSGKLPKPFKIIPRLGNWEQVLYITEPETWSAAAIFQATRLFASNLNDRLAQRFYNLVLLPRIRDDIAEFKRLNFHLYQALRKSLFKPGSFFKAIVLPLCESGNCSLREAVIITGVMAKNSIPAAHSAAAILKIAEMEWCGANSVFLKCLLDKKYALPYQAIDATVYHFIRFMSDRRKLPVLWHQSLLVFVQRYKEDLSTEQKDALLELTNHQFHYAISPDVRRELVNSKSRDIEEGIPTPMEE